MALRNPLRSDPERSGASTDVALAWTGAAALAATALFYVAVVSPLADTPFGEIFASRGRVPYAIAFFSWWSAVILFAKYIALRRERAALDLDLLPDRIATEIAPEAVPEFLAHLDALPADAPRSAVARRLRRALLHFQSRRDPREVVEQLTARAQADADAVESSYTLVRVFIWAVPILGFIGTVIGIGAAVAGFSESIGAAADLALMKNAIGGVTTGLGVAFDTTLLALVMSILIMFPASALQKAEEDLLVAIEDYTDERLVPRLEDPQRDAPAPEEQVIQEAVARAMAAHHAELRGWLDRLGQIGETLTGQVVSGWQKVDEQLRLRQAEQLEQLGRWAAARQREASDELSETQRNLLRDFRSHLEGMAAEVRRVQEDGAHRQGEQLAAVERLHRRLQEEAAQAGETRRAQGQELAGAADDLARTLARIRGEASELRNEGARLLTEFAEHLHATARDAHTFQRELVVAEESQAHGVRAAGERLAATLGRIDEQVAAIDLRRRQQLDALHAEDAQRARDREAELRRDAALSESQRAALSEATRELSTTLASLRESASAARGDLGALAERIAGALEAIERRGPGKADTPPRRSRFFFLG